MAPPSASSLFLLFPPTFPLAVVVAAAATVSFLLSLSARLPRMIFQAVFDAAEPPPELTGAMRRRNRTRGRTRGRSRDVATNSAARRPQTTLSTPCCNLALGFCVQGERVLVQDPARLGLVTKPRPLPLPADTLRNNVAVAPLCQHDAPDYVDNTSSLLPLLCCSIRPSPPSPKNLLVGVCT